MNNFHFLCESLKWNGFSMLVITIIVSFGFGVGFVGSKSNLRFCSIIAKKIKMLSFASDSPRQILLPMPKGVN